MTSEERSHIVETWTIVLETSTQGAKDFGFLAFSNLRLRCVDIATIILVTSPNVFT